MHWWHTFSLQLAGIPSTPDIICLSVRSEAWPHIRGVQNIVRGPHARQHCHDFTDIKLYQCPVHYNSGTNVCQREPTETPPRTVLLEKPVVANFARNFYSFSEPYPPQTRHIKPVATWCCNITHIYVPWGLLSGPRFRVCQSLVTTNECPFFLVPEHGCCRGICQRMQDLYMMHGDTIKETSYTPVSYSCIC